MIEKETTAALIDEIPVLAVLGAASEEGLDVRDAGELRIKETDRIATIAENLRRMGIEAECVAGRYPDSRPTAVSCRGTGFVRRSPHRHGVLDCVADGRWLFRNPWRGGGVGLFPGLLPDSAAGDGVTRGVVLSRAQAPVVVTDLAVPEPAEGQVLLKMEACGICHSDLFIAAMEKPPAGAVGIGTRGHRARRKARAQVSAPLRLAIGSASRFLPQLAACVNGAARAVSDTARGN